jgi:DNA topoisomerase-1
MDRDLVVVPSEKPEQSAQRAGLSYIIDSVPGIRRRKRGKGFEYLGPEGNKIQDEATLGRIRSLVIPPAWKQVWICMDPNGHLQATGRDARGRKQYRYHPRWIRTRDRTKFLKMVAFGHLLPSIRKHVDRDLLKRSLCREKVLATIVRLLELSLIRVGNEEYVRENGSYGLTTLRSKHVKVSGSTIRFRFKGKSGKFHDVAVKDRAIARTVKRCLSTPGCELFRYIRPDGQYVAISSCDVNDYLREITQQEITARDFRTWSATVLMTMALQQSTNGHPPTKKTLNSALKTVASALGNTPTVCRKSYIHPAVLDGYLQRKLFTDEPNGNGNAQYGLAPEEAYVLDYLEQAA